MGIAPSRESFSPSGRAANPASYRSAPPTSQRFFNGSAARADAGINGRQSSFGAGRNASSVQRQSGQTPARESLQNRGGRTIRTRTVQMLPGAVQSGRGGWQTFTPRSGASNDRGSAVNSARGETGQPESRGSNEGRPSLGGEICKSRFMGALHTPFPRASRRRKGRDIAEVPRGIQRFPSPAEYEAAYRDASRWLQFSRWKFRWPRL